MKVPHGFVLVPEWSDRDGFRYRASCLCAWVGISRLSFAGAQNDFEDHMNRTGKFWGWTE